MRAASPGKHTLTGQSAHDLQAIARRLGVYRRCEPAACPVGPKPYRRSQVRSVAGATPSRRAKARDGEDGAGARLT